MPEIHRVRETSSTNDDARAAAKRGAPHGSVWVAESQTAGRGRHGRTWSAAPGEALLFSVLLRVSCLPARVPPISLACGLVVRDAIGSDAFVKWPNDVLLGGKKVAGILVESAVAGSKVEHVIVGIGVNVHTKTFPPELQDIATSLALHGEAPDREALLTGILEGLDREIETVAQRGLGHLQARLRAHDALFGRRVMNDDGLDGVAEGIDADGRLQVRKSDDTLVKVVAGEVRLRAVIEP